MPDARRPTLVLLALAACAPFAPAPADRSALAARAEKGGDDAFQVSVAALSPEESRRYLGLDLAGRGVQPVWIRIENRTDRPAWYLPIGTDPEYFAPYEVAYMFHRVLDGKRNRRVDEHLLATAIPLEVPPRGAAEGFVHTHASQGARHVVVPLLTDRGTSEYRFVVEVPGGRWDFQRVDFATLYPAREVRDLDLDGLVAELGRLPCCTADADGRPRADPLNVVLVGEPPAVVFPFVERGWNFTEPLDPGSAWRSVKAFLLGSRYVTSPVSPLHLFGRPQDGALQKPRNDIDRRNHLRLWLAPFTFEGRPVWVGQVSRDIGVRFTTHSWYLTTHKIDPDVDEDRDYLLQDLLMSGNVSRAGYVPGVGAAPRSAPRHNLTGDPYFTDGRRLVLFLEQAERPLEQVEVFERR
ncbi:MAG: LssY C-terminal domain-containing protein [Anaeromyxobacteraceae bacterium]